MLGIVLVVVLAGASIVLATATAAAVGAEDPTSNIEMISMGVPVPRQHR